MGIDYLCADPIFNNHFCQLSIVHCPLTMTGNEKYMQRCLQLARLGAGSVTPNPMVGAVLVADDQVIGEGWHQQLGQAHAEVNCIDSVLPGNLDLVAGSILYVSLEPCAHFGKTP